MPPPAAQATPVAKPAPVKKAAPVLQPGAAGNKVFQGAAAAGDTGEAAYYYSSGLDAAFAAALPRTLWLFWYKGFERAPALERECLASWQRMNPGWTVRALNAADADRLIDRQEHYSDWTWSQASVEAKSDILRVELLARYGGVWADANTYCNDPLDDWLPQVFRGDTRFFSFQYPREEWDTWTPVWSRSNQQPGGPAGGVVIASWFMAGDASSPIVQQLRSTVRREWSPRNPYGNPSLPERYGYFWLHQLFNTLSSVPQSEFATLAARIPQRGPAAAQCRSGQSASGLYSDYAPWTAAEPGMAGGPPLFKANALHCRDTVAVRIERGARSLVAATSGEAAEDPQAVRGRALMPVVFV